MKNNDSSDPNSMHNPSSVTAIPLTREHCMIIGNRRGYISDTNPNGLSKQQMHTIKSILIYESNKNNNSNSNDNNNINNNNNNDMQGHFESWDNRNNINFSQPNTNIASFTMASFSSPNNNSTLDDSTPLPAILNHETPVRLNISIEHNYARIDGVFIDTIVLHATIRGKNYESKIIFRYIILPMFECTTKRQNIIQLVYLGGILNILICFIMIFMMEHPN